MKKNICLAIIICFFCTTSSSQAQSLITDQVQIVKAKVLSIISEQTMPIPGTDVSGIDQLLSVQILEGQESGKIVKLKNDYIKLSLDEEFWLRAELRGEDRQMIYAVADQDRLPGIYIFTIIFILAVLFFGGVQGVRGLVSLIGSLVLILYILLPSILNGYSPILVTIGVSSLIIVLGSYITHGFNKTTSSAVLGMIVTVLFTGFLAFWAVKLTKLSGFSSDEEVYLNLNAGGSIDMVGLLFGGIIIGLLGVLYDSAIGQSISVEELNHVAPNAPRKLIYRRAIRIGREHIGALVNTLAIAYVGVSLPLLLLFYTSNNDGIISLAATVNREIFATEIVRILIGSIGLILTVPITTAISVWMLLPKRREIDKDSLSREVQKLEHFHHHH